MKELIMSGVQIGNELQFSGYFSPTDLLRQRELAAGFAAQILSPLSLRNSYLSQQLYRAVFQTLPQQISEPQTYCDNLRSGILSDADRIFLEELWDLLELGAEASGDDLKRFWILASGCLLAQYSIKDFFASGQDLSDAYDRKLPSHSAPDWPSPSDSGEFILSARTKPYHLRLQPDPGTARLHEGGKIVPRRLTAVNHRGLSDMQVWIRVWDGPQERCQLCLAPGDYLYCSFVEDIPVYLYPTQASCADWTLSRQGSTLILMHKEEAYRRTDCTGRDIIALAPDGQGGWLVLERDGLNDTQYSGRAMNDDFLWYAQNVVDAAVLEDGTVMLLDERGTISSTHPAHADLQNTRFPSLHAASGRKGAHADDQ